MITFPFKPDDQILYKEFIDEAWKPGHLQRVTDCGRFAVYAPTSDCAYMDFITASDKSLIGFFTNPIDTWTPERYLNWCKDDKEKDALESIKQIKSILNPIEEKAEEIGEKKFDKKISVSSRTQKNEIVIEVSDTGTGVPDRVKDKIFDPFFTTKKVGKGTGLGLSISYGIIKDCGGNIEMVSEKGEGTKFIIRLPMFR